jgi:beta-1,2-mannobiose phosphorylase / 1,2-beta-oligomannan phosphorylase
MIEIKKQGIVLTKTKSVFENEGVLNPAAIRAEGLVHLFYRAVRRGNNSTIGYCKLGDPLTVKERNKEPLLVPEFDYESKGLEDPRIVKIDDLYYLTYTAYDGLNALGALAVSKDLVNFEKKGLIVPVFTFEEFHALTGSIAGLNDKYYRYNGRGSVNERDKHKIFLWDKNVIFFPRRINGKLHFLHRVRPDIQIVAVNELADLTPAFWQDYFRHFNEHILLTSKYKHEVSYIGGGCPPIETEAGWLLIYHGVHDTVKGYVYSACAALLDLNDPSKEIARLPYPLFRPELDWELKGEVNNVCFPTGAVAVDDALYIYYGAADERIACASVSLSALVKELLNNTIHA